MSLVTLVRVRGGGQSRYRKQGMLTLIFLALQREHPVRLLRCVRRPAPGYPGGCCSGGVGKLLAGGVGVVGVVNCGVEAVETAESVGGSRPDIIETMMSVVWRAIGWVLPETIRPVPGRVSRGPDRGGIGLEGGLGLPRRALLRLTSALVAIVIDTGVNSVAFWDTPRPSTE